MTSIPGAPGGTVSYSFTVRGVSPGVAQVATGLQSLAIPGLTTDVAVINVTQN